MLELRTMRNAPIVLTTLWIWLLLLATSGAAQDLHEDQKLSPGFVVAADGTTLVIGDPADDTVFVYQRVGDSWVEMQQLHASDGSTGDSFGCSVAVDGDVLAIGAEFNNAAYVFRFDGTQWVEEEKLSGSGGFGEPVTLSGNTLAVGSRYRDNLQGAADVFHFDGAQWIWKQVLNPGFLVALDGATLLNGNPGDEEVFVHEFDGTNWNRTQTINGGGSGSDEFGWAAAVDGSVLVVGAYNEPPNGAAHVYRFDGQQWSPEQRLTATDGASGDNFGWSVAIEEGTVVVGAKLDDSPEINAGSSYLYEFDRGQWIESYRLTASDGVADDHLGHSVELVNGLVFCGARWSDPGQGSGSTYFYTLPLRIDSVNLTRARYDRPSGVTLKGWRFESSTGTTVLFDASPATNVVVVDDNTITCDTPVVEPGQFNVDVTVTNDNGSDTLVDAFTFTPALQLSGNWVPGGDLTLTYLLDPQDNIYAIYGLPPILSIDTPPFDGQLCILPFYTFFILLGWPFDTWEQTFGIPNNPNLSGLEVLFQGLIGPEFGGRAKDAAWTNCASLVIE